jgi:hypothetical protein
LNTQMKAAIAAGPGSGGAVTPAGTPAAASRHSELSTPTPLHRTVDTGTHI